MKLFLKITMLLVFLLLFTSSKAKLNDFKYLNITFNSENVFPITGSFNNELEQRFVTKMALNEEKRMYLYIDSPGGSVDVVAQMLSVMDGYRGKVKFICIARRAYSAAFILFQDCDRRYMMKYGRLMAHHAHGGVYDELPRMREKIRVWSKLMRMLQKRVAKRMGISYRKYLDKIKDEEWYSMDKARSEKIIDGVAVSVKCSKELLENTFETERQRCSLFGCRTQSVIRSMCPLIEDKAITRTKE